MKKFLLFGCLLFSLNSVDAQSLSPFVITSGGGFFSASSASLSFTIGEMAMVQTFSNSGGILTQGFQQPPPNPITAIDPTGLPGVLLKIFPSPTTGKVYFSLTTPYAINISGSLISAIGQKISTIQIHQSSGQYIYEYNWDKLSSGVYIIELIMSKQASTSYKKINEKIFITH
jgi:hypothetical protein